MSQDEPTVTPSPPSGLEALSTRRLALELVAASFVVLVQELTLIRWLPSQVRVLAYYPNLVLLSASAASSPGDVPGARPGRF